jgi:ParB/RepB/Spo0J family partition protein
MNVMPSQNKRSTDAAQAHFVTAETALQPHPLAKHFPLLGPDEIKALAADIASHGLIEPVVLYPDAHDGGRLKILDGVNRYRACLRAKVEPRFVEFEGDEAAAIAFVLSKNLIRRHMKTKERRAAAAALIKATPEKSNLQIAKDIDASPTTVGAVRAEMEATGDVSKLETRTDTRGRKQPTRKARSRRTGSKGTRPVEPRRQAAAAPAMKVAAVAPEPTTTESAAPDHPYIRRPELDLLRKFCRFVLDRAKSVSVEPKDYAEWKDLRARVGEALRADERGGAQS